MRGFAGCSWKTLRVSCIPHSLFNTACWQAVSWARCTCKTCPLASGPACPPADDSYRALLKLCALSEIVSLNWPRRCARSTGARMIEDLDKVLEDTGLRGLTELRGLLEEVLGGESVDGRLTEQQSLQPRSCRVFRLRFAIKGRTQTVVVKRLKPEIARRNELVARRWLPAICMEEAGPPVLGSVAARTGDCVWHVYDDLGEWELDAREPDRERVKAAIDLIARIHTGFAGHALLGEVRLHGGDLGIHFYESNVRDAIYALQACESPVDQEQLRDRLLERLYKLLDELPERAK